MESFTSVLNRCKGKAVLVEAYYRPCGIQRLPDF
jgi:hypothetical protein